MRFEIVALLALCSNFASSYSLPKPDATVQKFSDKLVLKSKNASVVCEEFAKKWPRAVISPDDAMVYDQQREAHWSQTAVKAPSCIVTPESVENLQSVFKELVSANDTFALRGQGHSPLPLWGNIDGGVLVSMKAIDDIQYNETSQTVRAGFGNNWGTLFRYLEIHGRIALGGRAPTVGLATILGGGLSHSSNEHGFVSDSILEFEMIDSSGNLIKANADSNKDLYYALKVGGTNFGIVTHVIMRTYPLGKVWGGALVFTNDYRDDLMRAFATYQKEGQLDRKSALLSYMGISNNTIYVILAYLDEVEKPAAFKPFYEIPSTFDGTSMHNSLTDLMSQDVDRVVPRWTYGASTLFLDSDTYVDVAKIAQNATSRLATINGGSIVLQPQPISVSMVEESVSRGTSPLTDNMQKRPQLWLELNIGWNFESDDVKVGQILQDTLAQIEQLTKSRKLYSEFLFPNDAYLSQDPMRSLGQNTYRKLKRIARTYDPAGIFQTRLPGGFKLRA